jgi:hypothetical protein
MSGSDVIGEDIPSNGIPSKSLECGAGSDDDDEAIGICMIESDAGGCNVVVVLLLLAIAVVSWTAVVSGIPIVPFPKTMTLL